MTKNKKCAKDTDKELREEFRSLDDGNFFHTGSDGNLYFHPDKIADWWLEKLSQSKLETLEAIIKEVEKVDWRNAGLGNTPYDSDIIDYYEKALSDLLTKLGAQKELIENSK